jgi:chloramphenicol 3-O-phosphotransferase
MAPRRSRSLGEEIIPTAAVADIGGEDPATHSHEVCVSEVGKIIIITGSTGSGKSTTCAEFVTKMDDLWLHFGVDLFLGKIVPRQFIDGGPRANDGVHMVPDDPGALHGPLHMDMGRYGMSMIRTFHRMAVAAVRSGQNVVLDHITTLDPPLLHDCVDCFRNLPVFFVGLRPPAEVIPKRLDERLNTVIASLGREHAVRNSENKKAVAKYLCEQIFVHDQFDLIIDTDLHKPAEVVEIIVSSMGDGWGTAFPELAQRMQLRLAPFHR